MPTVPLYVPVNVSRQIASRWGLDLNAPEFTELIRGLCADALDTEAGITHTRGSFSTDCSWARLHREGHRCRHCGGS